MQVITTEKVPIKLWLDDIEEGALEQARNIANLPFVFKHISIMPDSHQGYGMPIGGVMATKGNIIPNAVGVDIGCGMSFVRTNINADTLDESFIKQLLKHIRNIPVGKNWRDTPVDDSAMPDRNILEGIQDLGGKVPELYAGAKKQMGTLGGGNHFIEIQKDEDNLICIMLHSGSRNLGKRVADHYNKLAIELNNTYYSSVPPKWELAFLPMGSIEGISYLLEMQYCVEFARLNRSFMMEFIKRAFQFQVEYACNTKTTFSETLAVPHNYARMENHFGENVLVHRKGAISAKEGELGIIPGSQGSNSYIVSGKGNKDSFTSCSHGAGRRLSRKKACSELSLEAEIQALNQKGIIHSIRHKKDLDEAPSAYKDINEVMANQSDLVEIKSTLTPLAVVKG